MADHGLNAVMHLLEAAKATLLHIDKEPHEMSSTEKVILKAIDAAKAEIKQGQAPPAKKQRLITLPEVRGFYVGNDNALQRVEEFVSGLRQPPKPWGNGLGLGDDVTPETDEKMVCRYQQAAKTQKYDMLDALRGMKKDYLRERDPRLAHVVALLWCGLMLNQLDTIEIPVINVASPADDATLFSLVLEHHDIVSDASMPFPRGFFLPRLITAALRLATMGYSSALLVIGVLYPDMVTEDCYPVITKAHAGNNAVLKEKYPDVYARFGTFLQRQLK